MAGILLEQLPFLLISLVKQLVNFQCLRLIRIGRASHIQMANHIIAFIRGFSLTAL